MNSTLRGKPDKRLNKNACFAIPSPIGYLGLWFDAEQLVKLEFLKSKPAVSTTPPPYVSAIIAQLKAYFKKPQPLRGEHLILGTPFQKKVWRQLCQIPVGETVTYGELATKLRTSARAIGTACRTNRIPLFIPCHRVVSKSDQGGFCGQQSGPFFKIKAWLLQYEQH